MLKFAEFDKPFEVHTGDEWLYHWQMLIEDGWPLHIKAFRSMVVRPYPTYQRNGKSGMMLVRKSLGSLRPSFLCRPCSISWSLTNLLRCIRGRGTLQDRWWKMDGHCIWEHEAWWLSKPTHDKELLCHSALLNKVATLFGVAQSKGLHGQCVLKVFWDSSLSERQVIAVAW